MKYCMRCGKEFEGESNFCPECAASVQPSKENRTEPVYQQPPVQQPIYQQVPPQQNPYQQPYQQAPYQQAPYQQAPYQQAPYQQPAVADAPSKGFAVLSFFFPLVGLILWLVWKDKTPLKAKSCGKGALIGVIVNIVFSIIYGVIIGVAASSMMYY
ncbi:MAG: hypothetical protein IJN78_09150 [Clostridia bacterium]|nr:hypothetical protein [Clostridia bacterium]